MPDIARAASIYIAHASANACCRNRPGGSAHRPGKTFLSGGLCFEAIKKGYKAYFRTIDSLINTMKMKEVARTSKAEYKRLLQANLIIIDDIMLFPVEKKEAVCLFNFINQIYEKTSSIITTNKKPAQWAQMLGDEVFATAGQIALPMRSDQPIKKKLPALKQKNNF